MQQYNILVKYQEIQIKYCSGLEQISSLGLTGYDDAASREVM